MAIRIILREGDDFLYKKSRMVTDFDQRLSILIDDLFDTMHAANGVGLAATQVGVLKRVAVINVGLGEDSSPIELVNPQIIKKRGETLLIEGCLSVPGVRGYVRRPEYVKIRAFDRHGKESFYEGEGLLAQAFCHEIEHLDGELFTDKVEYFIEDDE